MSSIMETANAGMRGKNPPDLPWPAGRALTIGAVPYGTKGWGIGADGRLPVFRGPGK